jgi:hypothetical protein
MFNDFIHTKLTQISAPVGQRLAIIVSGILLALAVYLSRHQLAHEDHKIGALRYFLQRYGEDSAIIKQFLAVRVVVIPSFYFALAWHFAYHYFWTPSLPTAILIQILLFILIFLPIDFHVADAATQRSRTSLLPPAMSPHKSVFFWRFRQLTGRNRPALLSLMAALVFLLLTCLLCLEQGPVLLIVLTLLVSSIFASTAMALQVAEDLKCGWMEPMLGISHRMFVGSYYVIGMMLGSVLSVVAVAALFAAGNSPLSEQLTLSLQLFAIGLSCPLLMPGLIFQIDARHPLINIMTCSMIGLFIDTAIFAHPLAIILLPITIYYTDQHQQNRFYSSYCKQQ